MKFITENIFLIALVLISGGLLFLPGLKRWSTSKVLSNLQLTQLVNSKKAFLIDLRSAEEFTQGFISSAKNIPAKELAARMAELKKVKDQQIVLVDANGNKTGASAYFLKKQGFNDIACLEGGIAGWQTAGLPLNR